VADPTAGAAAMRVLTGPRWRLGGRDISALWRRAVQLDDGGIPGAGPDADAPCLADAICDPGRPSAYSPAGYRRVAALARELRALRAHLCHPLPDLVAEVRRVLGVDVEVRAAQAPAAGWAGTEHLDAFADVVSGYAGRSSESVQGLLAFLDAAAIVENGLAPAEVSTAGDRVQILTVHAAKGLEWQVVAVPHLSARVFPSTASTRTWLTDAADLPPLLRGDRAVAGDFGVPVLDTADVNDRKRLSDIIAEHKDRLAQRRVDEERRLLYVAITRAEDTLLVSGHHWGASERKPRGPSDFLCEIKDIIDASTVAGDPCGVIEQWADAPADGDPNPLRAHVVESVWPADPLGSRRDDVDRGAALVAGALAAEAGPPDGTDDDPDGWAADVDALLAERNHVPQRSAVALPGRLSVSSLVDLGRDPAGAAQRLRRRLPVRPDRHAQLGTAFHDWVQRFYGAERLFDLDDLPGAVDGDGTPTDAEGLADLQAAFTASPWAARTPVAVEVPFEMVIGGIVVRGRIDAVFADPDGGATVVDWKTGAPPVDPEAQRHAAVQLAVYRQAWAALQGRPESSVRAAFHYVRSGRTVTPETLPVPEDLAALLATQPA
jgi:DNA helicase-2/ATP-dependent DNA helicase PcrA